MSFGFLELFVFFIRLNVFLIRWIVFLLNLSVDLEEILALKKVP